jgi:dTDP-4-amino-4,6-dideoxygalactose transaminase
MTSESGLVYERIPELPPSWNDASSRVATLEDAMAERLGARHAIAVVSPMAAFHLGYRAAGVSLGATILATSFADPTVVRAGVANGHRLAFVDVDERGHLSTDALRAQIALRGDPSVIVASHHAGHACETAALGELAPGALVIEDAVDALGAAAADGRPIGSPRHAAMTVVGIHPVRSGAPAQGAVLLTDDVALAARCRRLRDERVEHRLSELHAALALVELGRLARALELRARLAAEYDAALAAFPLVTPVAPAAETRSAWAAYLVRVPTWLRPDLHEHLRAHGVSARRLAVLLHRHPYYGRYADVLPVELPATERIADETLVIPMGTWPSDADVARLAAAAGALARRDSSGVAVAG